MLAEKLMQDQAEEVVQVVVNAALAGDLTAAKIIVERLVPARKDRPLDPDAISLPPLRSDNLVKAVAAVVRAVANGKLEPSQGEALTRMLEQHRKAVELQDIETRLAKLEQAQEDGRCPTKF